MGASGNNRPRLQKVWQNVDRFLHGNSAEQSVQGCLACILACEIFIASTAVAGRVRANDQNQYLQRLFTDFLPRRSREFGHLCSDRVDHIKNARETRHHPRRRREPLGARQNVRHLTPKKTLVPSKLPLKSTGSGLARAKLAYRSPLGGQGLSGPVAHL